MDQIPEISISSPASRLSAAWLQPDDVPMLFQELGRFYRKSTTFVTPRGR